MPKKKNGRRKAAIFRHSDYQRGAFPPLDLD